MSSKNTEAQKLAQQKKDQEDVNAYLEEIRAVDMKHKLSFQPIISHKANGGMMPEMQVVRLPEEIQVQKAEEKPTKVTKAKK